MTNLIWNNGHWMADNERVFYVQDRIRYGDGIFDTMLVRNKEAVNLDMHYQRLKRHAQIMQLNFIMTKDDYTSLVAQIIKNNKIDTLNNYALNTLISRGLSPPGLRIQKNAEAHIILKLSEVSKTNKDIHAHIATSVRRNEGSPLSLIKSCSYGDNILAMIEAESHGCNEAVMLNNKDLVTCATAGNIFCVHNDVLITPPLGDGAMDGTTRQIIIERYDAVEKSITMDMLTQSKTIFTTNSIRGMSFFKSLNGIELGKPSLKFDNTLDL